MSPELERLTVFLTTASSAALREAADITGDGLTDVINRSVQAYAMQVRVVAAGAEVLIRHGKDTEDGPPSAGESTQAAPDLLSVVSDALSTGQGPLLPLPAETRRLLAARVTDAVAPLVTYRPVWDSSLPPGGRVCSICGQPVESEPCAEHGPSGDAAVPEGGE